MRLGTEKNISTETDSLMENCDSIQVNNITRKRLQNIDLMHHLSKRIPPTCIISALFPHALDRAAIYLPPKNRRFFPRELFACEVQRFTVRPTNLEEISALVEVLLNTL